MAEEYVYRTAGGLYRDCAAGTAERTEAAAQRYQHCLRFIEQIFNSWNLNQDNGICSRHIGGELPKAYVDYWRERHLGVISGALTSGETSVNQFLDSQKQPCPVPDPKTHPP
ncbi:MAG TPA: hypothetical protein VE397_21010 [Stellaceae bacterium]|nr:hypothetical protein [Stellaceae bacterium]